MNNSIFVIKPYKWEGLWVFDDANVGLVKEPFGCVRLSFGTSLSHRRSYTSR